MRCTGSFETPYTRAGHLLARAYDPEGFTFPIIFDT
jgi:hypothetical protein